MLRAAKEEMPALPVVWGESVLPLAADPVLLENRIRAKSQLAENSRQGFQLRSSTLRWASSEVKSRTALGIRGTLYDEGIGSRCNGKERDSESGLDEFGARYYASSMGRFMTSDPIGIMKQKFADPQQWNMYAYARNNPLSAIDVSGQFVYSIHDALTTRTLAAAGYSSSVAKAISWENQKTDLYFNDEAHAYMHSQARRVSQNGRLHLQTAAEARAEEHKFIETSLGDAASEVWAGDFAAARKNFGGALHAAQDEKHEWTPFQLHTGNPFNDQLTSVGRFQEDTDFNPTAQQLQDARRRSAEVVQQFEDAVRVNGALNQKTNEETEERLYEFRNGLDPH